MFQPADIPNHPPLPTFLQPHLEALREHCRKHYVRYLYVMGSVLRPEEFREDSDIDWVYEWYEEQVPDHEYLKIFDSFWMGLQRITGRKVDLIHYPSLKNPYFIEEVDETKRLIYDAEREKVSV